jgi:uncharacterized membrane protein YqjE
MSQASESARPRGLFGSLRRLGDDIVGLVQTRVEILSLEWAEERGNLMRLLLLVIAIVACLQLAIIVGILFLLLVVGEENRVAVLGYAALLLLLAAAGGALGMRAWLKRRPPVFATTIAELRKDREWIRGGRS